MTPALCDCILGSKSFINIWMYLPKGRSSPKLQELLPINALSSAFTPAPAWQQVWHSYKICCRKEQGTQYQYSPHMIFLMTVNWFLPHLAGKIIRSASSASKEAAAPTEMQKNSPSYPRAGENFLLLSDLGLFSSFLIGYQSFPFYPPAPCLKLHGDPSWQR